MQNGEQPKTLEEAMAAIELLARDNRLLEEKKRRLEEQLRSRDIDSVSGLPLRPLFDEDLATIVEKMIALREAGPYLRPRVFDKLLYPPRHGDDEMVLVLGFVDIWLLREWNDRFNHAVGDMVLKGFADAVRAHAVPWLKVYRAGDRGDEFMVIACATQEAIAEIFQKIKATFAKTPVPEGNPFGPPTFDVGFCTIYEALWAHARIVTESSVDPREVIPEQEETVDQKRNQLTRVKELLKLISDTRGRVQKVKARALYLVEEKRADPVRYNKICKPLFGGTHLDDEDITYLLEVQDSDSSDSTKEAEFQRIAARPYLQQWASHSKRYVSLRGKDGIDSLRGQVIIEAALHMKPFERRTSPR